MRDRARAHVRLGSGEPGAFPMAGVATAALGALALFVVPTWARHGGYPGASAALVAVSLPLAAAALVVRAWGLARIAAARSPGELLASHHGTLVAGLAAAFVATAATLLLALSLVAAGHVVETLSGHVIGSRVGLYIAALFVALTAAPAGLRAAGALARLQTALVGVGAVALATLVVVELGGPRAALDALARAAELLRFGTTAGRGGGDYPAALALAGALSSEDGWSGLTVLSLHVEVVGALLVLVWMPWALAADGPRQLARPLTGLTAGAGGALLLALAGLVGWGVLALDAAPPPGVPNVPPASAGFVSGITMALAMRLVGNHPWIAAAFGLAALAALHALAQALVGAAVGAVRPLAGRRLRAASGSFRDLAAAQVTALAVVAIAAVLCAALPSDLVAWSELALACAALTVLPLAAACWFPTLTGAALAAGLALGAATIAALPFVTGAPSLQGMLPAFVVAAATAFVVTALRPRDSRRQRRLDAARQLDAAVSGRGEEHVRAPLLVLAALAWIFFAIGPGAVVGNDLFGAPDIARARWGFALPSLAVWQLLSWAAGVALVWFVSREHAQLSRAEAERLAALGEAAKAAPQTDPQTADRRGKPGPSATRGMR